MTAKSPSRLAKRSANARFHLLLVLSVLKAFYAQEPAAAAADVKKDAADADNQEPSAKRVRLQMTPQKTLAVVATAAVALLKKRQAVIAHGLLESKLAGRSTGVGRGKTPRKKRPALIVKDRVTEWRRNGDVEFLSETNFKQKEFDELYALCKEKIEQPRDVRATMPSPKGKQPGKQKAGRKPKLSGENSFALLLKFAKQGGPLQELGVHWGLKKSSETLVHTLTATLMALHDKIHWPYRQEQKQIREEGRMYKQAIGAGDGTSSPTTRKKGQYSGHRNGFVRNQQAIVDPSNRVIFAAGGFGGSASDAAQLDSTGILGNLDDGSVILADSAYKTLEGVLAAGSEEAKEDPKAFVKNRSRIEHLFARMKKHFRVIDQKWCAPGKCITQAQLFVLCAILHNCMLDYGHFKDY